MGDKNAVHHVQEGKSYGHVEVNFKSGSQSRLFLGLPESINAWSSHGDSVPVHFS